MLRYRFYTGTQAAILQYYLSWSESMCIAEGSRVLCNLYKHVWQ